MFVPFFSIYSIYDYTSIWFIVSKLFYCHLKKTAGSLFEQEEISCRFSKTKKISNNPMVFENLLPIFPSFHAYTLRSYRCLMFTSRDQIFCMIWFPSVFYWHVHEREISTTTEEKTIFKPNTAHIINYGALDSLAVS